MLTPIDGARLMLLRRLQSALLPSILDKAFKGELQKEYSHAIN
jgi:hypothetical protein